MEPILTCVENCEPIIRCYADMLLRITIKKTANREYAEDIVQDTFIKLFEIPRTFNDEEHLKSWLICVAINHCKKLWRSSWMQKTVALEETDHPTTMMNEKSEVYYALLHTPDKYRIPLYLYYYEEYSIKQIADLLHLKPATVETRIHRGRAILKEKLKGDMYNE